MAQLDLHLAFSVEVKRSVSYGFVGGSGRLEPQCAELCVVGAAAEKQRLKYGWKYHFSGWSWASSMCFCPGFTRSSNVLLNLPQAANNNNQPRASHRMPRNWRYRKSIKNIYRRGRRPTKSKRDLRLKSGGQPTSLARSICCCCLLSLGDFVICLIHILISGT